ncbi:MAG: VanW family protein [Oscillospiraceae bacterium]
MKRKLFCQISPLAYKISRAKCRIFRTLKDLSCRNFSSQKSEEKLPYKVYASNSLIRRKLGNVDSALQENKAVNLKIAAPHINGVMIKPNEVFSFWHLIGNCSTKKGYKEGLTINCGEVSKDIGGGMCQFTNMIHWLILHTPLEIIEHHHHDGIDMFPDYGRTIPFGTGTSIMYNYLDYRFKNTTENTYQLITYVDDKYLCGEIYCDKKPIQTYHIKSEDEHFERKDDSVYRVGKVVRTTINSQTGQIVSKEIIKNNYAKILYDESFIKEKIEVQ